MSMILSLKVLTPLHVSCMNSKKVDSLLGIIPKDHLFSGCPITVVSLIADTSNLQLQGRLQNPSAKNNWCMASRNLCRVSIKGKLKDKVEEQES